MAISIRNLEEMTGQEVESRPHRDRNRSSTYNTLRSGGPVSISIHPDLEARLRSRAEAEGLTVEAYIERLVQTEQQGESELEALALEGLNSGEPMEIQPGYWEEKHRRLDERLKTTGTR